MTTSVIVFLLPRCFVVEAYRLDRYDNIYFSNGYFTGTVVEAYRLDRYDNFRRGDPCGW